MLEKALNQNTQKEPVQITRTLLLLEVGEEAAFALHRERSIRNVITREHKQTMRRYKSRVDSENKVFYIIRTK